MALLFVYGTLRHEARDALGHHARDHLARAAFAIGPATAAGRLFDLGSYPGLWAPAVTESTVVGDVIDLAVPAVTFAWLDRYEGREYRRERRAVELAGGERVDAWIYLLRRKPQAPVIRGGDWLVHTSPYTTAVTPQASSPPYRCHRSRS